MFIKSISILSKSKVIKDVRFHKGVNLIVDETLDSNRESGNNVGKTTFLRLIDYCLGSKKDSIYKDAEFKEKNNKKVKEFLENPSTIIKLVLTEDLNNTNAEKEIIIERNFGTNKSKIQKINKNTFKNDKEFCQELKKIIYKDELNKPSFRNIIRKNIRNEKEKLLNVVKVLDKSVNKATYESVYLFWLGITIKNIGEKDEITKLQKIEKSLLKKLMEENSPSQIEQSLIYIKEEIKEIQQKKKKYNINPNYQEDIKKINEISSQINKINTKLGGLKYRQNLTIENQTELNKEILNIDKNQVKFLYDKVKKLIPSIQKSFEDVLLFHNQMIKNKIEYIIRELPTLNNDISKLETKRTKLLEEESKYVKKISKSEFTENLEEIIKKLNERFEQKGRLEEQNSQIKKWRKNIDENKEKLKKINKKIENKDSEIKQNLQVFNRYFGTLSKKFYKEPLILSADRINSENEKSYYDLKIKSSQPGTGEKKVQIAVFDLAYIQFADELKINCPHFILHDQLGSIHGNQLNNLFKNIVPNINCQYIAAVLSDKIIEFSKSDISKYQILKLSQKKKLFEI